MKLLTVPAPGHLSPVTVPEPVAGPGEIRLRVACVGICGSDVEVFTGRRAPKSRYGHPVLGHEVSGVIDQIGPGVTGVRIGDQVSCIEGWGALTDYVITRPWNALVFDDRIAPADGCLLEVLPGVAMTAWKTGIERGAAVLVVGQGLSGLLITALVAVHGCRRLVAVEPGAVKAAMATELGATDVRAGRLSDEADALRETYPDGFDLAIIATPACVVNEVIPLMRPRSRIVAYGGLDAAAHIDMMALHHRSVSLVKEGELINGAREARAVWREALQLVYDGVLPLGRLRTHDLPMAAAEVALRMRADPDSEAIHVVLHQDPGATMPGGTGSSG